MKISLNSSHSKLYVVIIVIIISFVSATLGLNCSSEVKLCFKSGRKWCTGSAQCLADSNSTCSSCSISSCPRTSNSCESINNCYDCTNNDCLWCESRSSCMMNGLGKSCTCDCGGITSNSNCPVCNSKLSCSDCLQSRGCSWCGSTQQCMSSECASRNCSSACLMNKLGYDNNNSNNNTFVIPSCSNSPRDCIQFKSSVPCLRNNCVWIAATSRCVFGSRDLMMECSSDNSSIPIPLDYSSCTFQAWMNPQQNAVVFSIPSDHCESFSYIYSCTYASCLWCEDGGGSCLSSSYVNSKDGKCKECSGVGLPLERQSVDLIVWVTIAVTFVVAVVYLLFTFHNTIQFLIKIRIFKSPIRSDVLNWYCKQSVFAVAFLASGLLNIWFDLYPITLPIFIFCSLMNVATIVMRKRKNFKIFMTDENMRLSTIALGSMLLLVMVQTVYYRSNLAGNYISAPIAFIPLVFGQMLISLSPSMEILKSTNNIPVTRPRILIASSILGQIITIAAYSAVLLISRYCTDARSHVITQGLNFSVVEFSCSATSPLILTMLGVVHAYANNEVALFLNGCCLRQQAVPICAVVAFGPLLTTASIGVFFSPWVFLQDGSPEMIAVALLGMTGIARSMLQQIALSSPGNVINPDIAGTTTAQPLRRRLTNMIVETKWSDLSWQDRWSKMRNIIFPFLKFLGSWRGNQWMIFVNSASTVVITVVFVISKKIPSIDQVHKYVYGLIGAGTIGAVVAAHALFVNWKPKYKILPMDESLRISCIIKAALVVLKGFILANESIQYDSGSSQCFSIDSSSPPITQRSAFEKTLLVLYMTSLGIAAAITFVDIRNIWSNAASINTPHPRIFLIGYAISFLGAKLVAILLPIASKFGNSVICSVCPSDNSIGCCLTSSRQQLLYGMIGIALFFGIYFNNEIARYLEYCKLSNFSNKRVLGLSESYEGIQTSLPFCLAALLTVGVLVFLMFSVSFNGSGCSDYAHLRFYSDYPTATIAYISGTVISFSSIGVAVTAIGMTKFRPTKNRASVIIVEKELNDNELEEIEMQEVGTWC